MTDSMNAVKSQFKKVSVIIVNWNGASFLERCLEALMVQTVKPHEIIIVDNASTDGSVEIVRRFPTVRLLLQSHNLGFARGNNLAIKAASRYVEWIALINPDAFPEPRWLEALLEAESSNPGFVAFCSQLVNAGNPEILDGVGDAYHVSGLVWRIGHGSPRVMATENVCEVFSPCAAAALYQRSALQDVGGFDEDYFCYVEDIDLGFRLRLIGHRCLYVPQSVAHHVGSGTTGGKHSDFALYYGHRNLVWTFVKDMPNILFWLLLPLHLALNLVSVLWFVFSGRAGVILRAKRDALLGLPRMWHKRKKIQQSRVATIGAIWKRLDKQMIATKLDRKSI